MLESGRSATHRRDAVGAGVTHRACQRVRTRDGVARAARGSGRARARDGCSGAGRVCVAGRRARDEDRGARSAGGGARMTGPRVHLGDRRVHVAGHRARHAIVAGAPEAAAREREGASRAPCGRVVGRSEAAFGSADQAIVREGVAVRSRGGAITLEVGANGPDGIAVLPVESRARPTAWHTMSMASLAMLTASLVGSRAPRCDRVVSQTSSMGGDVRGGRGVHARGRSDRVPGALDRSADLPDRSAGRRECPVGHQDVSPAKDGGGHLPRAATIARRGHATPGRPSARGAWLLARPRAHSGLAGRPSRDADPVDLPAPLIHLPQDQLGRPDIHHRQRMPVRDQAVHVGDVPVLRP